MHRKKNKGPLRNFFFLKEADASLLHRAEQRGQDMVVVLEDLLLDRRQLSPALERFILQECQRTGLSRRDIIEAALLNHLNSKETADVELIAKTSGRSWQRPDGR